MKYFFLVLIVSNLVACNTTGPTFYPAKSNRAHFTPQGSKKLDSKMPSKAGACYAKCLIPDKYETHSDTLGIFSEAEEIPQSLMVHQEVAPTSTRWVKKKAYNNCLSADPEDCLVWCLQETQAQYAVPVISIDSTTTALQQVVTLEKRELIEAGGYTEWKEIICQNKVNAKLVNTLRNGLLVKGYEPGLGELDDKQFRDALTKFQKDNHLPLGQLDLESLQALGVDY